MRILIIEDSVKINQLLALFARQDGYDVSQAYSAEEAIKLMNENEYDVVLTDLMLPTMQGEELISLMKENNNIYTIVISAKSSLNEKLDVLRLGADDYITKPFSVEEIMAKLSNVKKRIRPRKMTLYTFKQGTLKINMGTRQVYILGEEVILTNHEFRILLDLIHHPNQIRSRDQLLATCFDGGVIYDRTIDAHLKNIRKKLRDSANQPDFIKTHYGVGYQFIGESDD